MSTRRNRWSSTRSEPPRRRRSSSTRSEPRHNLKMYIPSIKTLARQACPPGMIERKGYTRKYSSSVRTAGFTVERGGKTYRVYPKKNATSVDPTCVKNTGKPGAGIPRSIGPLRKGELAKFGYSFRKGGDTRRHALRQAVNEFGPLGVFRKLDAVTKLTTRTAPEASAIFKKDRNWIMSSYAPLRASNYSKK